MLKIGLTGGIGSGKTLISSLFSILGIPVFYSDAEAKALYYDDHVKLKVIKLLGESSYIDNKLNKQHISSIIFTDKSQLQALNAIIHPAVRDRFEEWASQQHSQYVIQESALIFEINIAHHFDKTILVTAPKDIRIARVIARDGVSRDQVIDRIKNQLDDESKIKLADITIINDGLEYLIPQILTIHRQLIE